MFKVIFLAACFLLNSSNLYSSCCGWSKVSLKIEACYGNFPNRKGECTVKVKPSDDWHTIRRAIFEKIKKDFPDIVRRGDKYDEKSWSSLMLADAECSPDISVGGFNTLNDKTLREYFGSDRKILAMVPMISSWA
jgi:hypothetical protein